MSRRRLADIRLPDLAAARAHLAYLQETGQSDAKNADAAGCGLFLKVLNAHNMTVHQLSPADADRLRVVCITLVKRAMPRHRRCAWCCIV